MVHEYSLGDASSDALTVDQGEEVESLARNLIAEGAPTRALHDRTWALPRRRAAIEEVAR
jgi:hypothetical protein